MAKTSSELLRAVTGAGAQLVRMVIDPGGDGSRGGTTIEVAQFMVGCEVKEMRRRSE